MGAVKGKILVIDDEEALLEACEETLTYHGYEVELRNRPEAGIEADGQLVRATVSVGAHLAQPGQTCADAIGAADESLYRAKRTGRDRVCTSWRLALAC